MRLFHLLAWLSLVLTFCCGSRPQESLPQREAKQKLDQLFKRTAELWNARNPLDATRRGIHQWDDQLTNPLEPSHLERIRRENQELRALLESIPASELEKSDRLNLDILIGILNNERKGLENGFQEYTQIDLGYLSYTIPMLAAYAREGSPQPFAQERDYDHYAARLEAAPAIIASGIQRLTEGLEQKRTVPRVIVERQLQIFRNLVSKGVDGSPFCAPLRRMPATFSTEEKARIEARFRSAWEEKFRPALQELIQFIETRYLPQSRLEVGLGALPGGDLIYKHLIELNVDADLSPEQIHQIGLSECERISLEMDAMRQKLGFKGDMKAFLEELRTAPKYHFETREQILAAYKEILAESKAKAGQLFEMADMPEVEVRPVEEFIEASAAGAYYDRGPMDGTTPSAVVINTFEPRSRERSIVAPTALFLGIPGHHYRNSLEKHLNIPAFRSQFKFGAYVDGWGLYAEFLGSEMGLYEDPYRYFGKLAMEMRRAARLVIDTGIHSMGWSREQGVNWLMARLPLSRDLAEVEVDRYIGSPAEVLSYKIGQLKFNELRNRAASELGRHFSFKEFHRELLKDGPMPLNLLETKILEWIASKKK